MEFKEITLRKTKANSYCVIIDNLFADELSIDEALGCVASALFSKSPMFVQTYLQWHKRERFWNSSKYEAPLLALEHKQYDVSKYFLQRRELICNAVEKPLVRRQPK